MCVTSCRKLFSRISVLLFIIAAVSVCVPCRAAGKEFISGARWLWSGDAEKTPMTAFLRCKFKVEGKVKNGWFYTFCEKGGSVYLNGKKLSLSPWKDLEKYTGHVKGKGARIGELLKQGENVLAVRLERKPRGVYGMILRGEIEYADGRKVLLESSGKQFKANGREIPGWNNIGFNDEDWRPAWEQGDARMTPWSKYGNTVRIYCTPEEFRRFTAMPGFPAEKLKQEPAVPKCRIVYRGTTPGIEINGRVIPPYTISSLTPIISAPQESMVKNAAKAGLKLYCIYFSSRSRYDLENLDLSIRRILSLVPDAFFMISFRIFPTPEWLNANPDELIGYAVKNKTLNKHDYRGNPQAPSLASLAFRREVGRQIREIGDFVKSKIWSRRVVGFMAASGGSGDGSPWGCHSMPDTGKRMTEAFRTFLKEKYASDRKLQQAWGDPAVTLKTAEVPDAAQRHGSGNCLRDLNDPRDRRLNDYYLLYHKVFTESLLDMGKSAKKSFPGRLFGTWFGYAILGYTPEGSTANLEPLLKSPYFDMLWATTRGYNLADGLTRHVFSLFHRYGKLASTEGDIRTHVGKEQAQPRWLCRTPEETRSTVRKLVGNALLNGAGYHTVSFAHRQYMLDCPEALEALAESVKLWKSFFAAPPKVAAETAVVLDMRQVWQQGPPVYYRANMWSNMLLTHPLQTLNFSGIPYELMSPKEFLASEHPWKTVIFLNQFSGSADEISAIVRKIRRPGVTAIWNYAPGLVTEKGYSAASMEALTGVKLKVDPGKKRFNVRLDSGKKLYLSGPPATYTESPRVSGGEKACEVLGRYDDGGQALIRKKLPDGSTAVFAGLPPNDPLLWRRLLTDAGSTPYTETGFQVRRNSRLLMVYSGRNANVPPESRIVKKYISQKGRVEVRLPRKVMCVKDCFTGKVLLRNGQKFVLTSDQVHTWLLKIEE